MKKALHTKSVFGVNLVTALNIASAAGFGAVEIVSSRLDEYLQEGFTGDDLTEDSI